MIWGIEHYSSIIHICRHMFSTFNFQRDEYKSFHDFVVRILNNYTCGVTKTKTIVRDTVVNETISNFVPANDGDEKAIESDQNPKESSRYPPKTCCWSFIDPFIGSFLPFYTCSQLVFRCLPQSKMLMLLLLFMLSTRSAVLLTAVMMPMVVIKVVSCAPLWCGESCTTPPR
jgi:hypothetical protein